LRVLVVRLGAMGDVLHALPAVTALRATMPESWIGWAIEPQWIPLLRADSFSQTRGSHMPVVDTIHAIPAKQWARRPLSPRTFGQIRQTRHALLAGQYDICVDLQGAIRSAWIGRMAGADRMVGEADPREPLARWLFGERIATAGVHVIEQAREVISGALKMDLPDCPAALPFDPRTEEWFDAWLAERNIERFAILNPGAGWGSKRWPPERYAALADELRQMGYAAVVNAGPGESQLAESICIGAKRAFAFGGNIGQLIACTRRASIFIGGDTGPLHLASALQIPVVGIYGPTDPARNGPYGAPARVLRHPASKRDHSRRSEPEAGLLTITVSNVVAAARELLAESAAESSAARPEHP
jgi:heptosyltransferase I